MYVFLLSLISCEKDIIDSSNSEVDFKNLVIKNERLVFDNETEFKQFLQSVDKLSEQEVMKDVIKYLYSNDFYSLKPIFDEKNIDQLKRHINLKKDNLEFSRLSNSIEDEDLIENFDDLEDVFGESFFASFLNQNSEIQIGNRIYKYTNSGLLITNLEDIEELYEFMVERDVISLENVLNSNTVEEYPSFNIDGGYKVVTPKIDSYLAEKFMAPVDPDDHGSWASSSGSNNNPLEINQDLNTQIESLEVCSGKKPWIANMFGTTRVCIDKYENRRRVKVKYYNVDFLLGYALGVKVKHQVKGFGGIWSKVDTEQVAMGINSLTWFFDHSKVFNNTANSMTVNYYTRDNKLYSSSNAYTSAVYVGQDKPLPNLPFADDVDIIIELANHLIGFDLTELQVRTLFYNGLYGQAKSILNQLNRNMNKVGVVINQSGQSIVQYYNFSNNCNDCSKQEKIFDFGFATPKITYNFGVGNGGSFDDLGFKDLEFNFKHPNITSLSMYGMAKYNGQWHGVRMVF